MLIITTSGKEYFDESTFKFVDVPGRQIELEHSLISLSKWEAKWCKPFLTKEKKTNEQIRDYVKCMIVSRNVPEKIEDIITDDQLTTINEYIDAPMTATTFGKTQQTGRQREVITSELIYYWMIALNIPFECQKWHLNRLLTLIRVCSIKNSPQKKMSRNEILAQNRALNAARRNQLQTKG
jgi:hypothetical protein